MSRRKLAVERLQVGMVCDMGVAGALRVTGVRRRGDYVTISLQGARPATYEAGSFFTVVGR